MDSYFECTKSTDINMVSCDFFSSPLLLPVSLGEFSDDADQSPILVLQSLVLHLKLCFNLKCAEIQILGVYSNTEVSLCWAEHSCSWWGITSRSSLHILFPAARFVPLFPTCTLKVISYCSTSYKGLVLISGHFSSPFSFNHVQVELSDAKQQKLCVPSKS